MYLEEVKKRSRLIENIEKKGAREERAVFRRGEIGEDSKPKTGLGKI